MRTFLVALNVGMGLITLAAGFRNLRRGIATESKQALRLAFLAPYLAHRVPDGGGVAKYYPE